MKLNNKTYDILKWVCLIALPAFGTLYSTLSGIWGLPYGEQILQTTVAVELCLGALLGISATQYKKTNSK